MGTEGKMWERKAKRQLRVWFTELRQKCLDLTHPQFNSPVTLFTCIVTGRQALQAVRARSTTECLIADRPYCCSSFFSTRPAPSLPQPPAAAAAAASSAASSASSAAAAAGAESLPLRLAPRRQQTKIWPVPSVKTWPCPLVVAPVPASCLRRLFRTLWPRFWQELT